MSSSSRATGRGWGLVGHSGPSSVAWGGGASAGPGSARPGRGRPATTGGVDASTPSRMVGPLPALTTSVNSRSMTSSLSVRPPQVSCGRAAQRGQLDLEERAVLDVRLGERRRRGSRRAAARSAGARRRRRAASRRCRRGRPRRPGWRSAVRGRHPRTTRRARRRPPCCRGRGSRGRG